MKSKKIILQNFCGGKNDLKTKKTKQNQTN